MLITCWQIWNNKFIITNFKSNEIWISVTIWIYARSMWKWRNITNYLNWCQVVRIEIWIWIDARLWKWNETDWPCRRVRTSWVGLDYENVLRRVQDNDSLKSLLDFWKSLVADSVGIWIVPTWQSEDLKLLLIADSLFAKHEWLIRRFVLTRFRVRLRGVNKWYSWFGVKST